MNDLLIFAVVIALIAAFVIFLADKWGFINWLQINGNEFLSKLAGCKFCLSFWIVLLVTILFASLGMFPNFGFMLIPVLSTPITRFIL